MSFPGSPEVKASVCDAGELGSIPGLGRSPGWRKWQPTPVFLPGKSHGQRSLVGYTPQGSKESDTTEWLHFLSHSQNRLTGGASGKESASQCRRQGTLVWSPDWEDSQEEEMATHSYSCLENSMDKGVWRATVHGITESDMTERLSTIACKPQIRRRIRTITFRWQLPLEGREGEEPQEGGYRKHHLLP